MANVRVCQWCGKVLDGPDKGKKVKWPADPMHHQADVPTEYKGLHISHGQCSPACAKNQLAKDLRARSAHKK